MSTAEATTSVSQQVENLVDAALTLGTSVFRLGGSVMVIPISLLPPKARQDTIQTAHNVIDSVGRVNLSIFKVATKASNVWLHELDSALSAAALPAAAEPLLDAPAAK